MKFTTPDVSVYYKVQEDSSIQVNKRKFKQIAIEESEAVWSDYGLSDVETRVREFEIEYKEHDSSGLYQLNNEEGELRVIAHPLNQYPLDSAMTNEEEPGYIPSGEWDELNEHLIDAQKEVATRVTDRIDEFVTR